MSASSTSTSAVQAASTVTIAPATLTSVSSTTLSTTEIYQHKHGEATKLTPTNYHIWSTDIMYILKGCNLWGIIQGTKECPQEPIQPAAEPESSRRRASSTVQPNTNTNSNPTAYKAKLADYKARYNRAAAILNASITKPARSYISTTSHGHPAKMWKDLETRLHSRVNQAATGHIRRCFRDKKMSEGEGITSYITKLMNYQTELEGTQHEISEQDLVAQILEHLTPKYEGVVSRIYEKDANEQTLDYVRNKLCEFKGRLNIERTHIIESTALATTTKNQRQYKKQYSKYRRGGGKYNHSDRFNHSD